MDRRQYTCSTSGNGSMGMYFLDNYIVYFISKTNLCCTLIRNKKRLLIPGMNYLNNSCSIMKSNCSRRAKVSAHDILKHPHHLSHEAEMWMLSGLSFKNTANDRREAIVHNKQNVRMSFLWVLWLRDRSFMPCNTNWSITITLEEEEKENSIESWLNINVRTYSIDKKHQPIESFG